MTTKYSNMVEALDDLKARGFTIDFNLHTPDGESQATLLKNSLEHYKITEMYRFEGPSSPDDNSVLYAITGPNDVKGIYLDAYGVYADVEFTEILTKLNVSRVAVANNSPLGDDQDRDPAGVASGAL